MHLPSLMVGTIVRYKEDVLMQTQILGFSAQMNFSAMQTTKWILPVLRIRTHPIQVSSRIRNGVSFRTT